MVLYRKYRSKNFQEIYGQEPIVKVLKQALQDSKVAHAYLFAGPRGTGKTSVARILAKALNCLDPKQGEPCNKCKNCQAINEARFLDLIEIDAASNRGIDEIRELKERVNFLPVEGKYKVYIIDEVHMLTNEAFNALLKTLEEPPERVVFVLATTEVHKVPLTIISRTQRFDYRLAKSSEVKKKVQHILSLEKVKMEDEALDLIVETGGGSFRDTETVLEKVISSFSMSEKLTIKKTDVEEILGFASSELVKRFLTAIMDRDRPNSLLILDEVQQSGINLPQFIKQLLESARKFMLRLLSEKPQDPKIRKLVEVIKEFSQAGYEQKFSLVPVLPLEIALVKLTDEPQLPAKEIVVEPSPAKTKAESSKEKSPNKELEKIKDTANAPISIELIHEKWTDLLRAAKQYNHHLVAILMSAKPLKFTEDTLALEVPFAFHKKRIEDKDTQKMIKQMTKAVYGKSVVIKALINKNLAQKKEQDVLSNEKIVEEIFSDDGETPV